jgi:hypothetical protein
MFNKKIEEITYDDIMELINLQIPEDKQLEYKCELNLNNDRNKLKLLKEIIAFANTQGGYIVVGISDNKENVKQYAAVGFKIDESEDVFKQKLQNIIEMSTEPQLKNVESRLIKDNTGNLQFLIIRVYESIQKPHRIKNERNTGFYLRTMTGVSPMDVNDLRTAFCYGNDLKSMLRKYEEESLSTINEEIINTFGEKKPVFILNSYPLGSLVGSAYYSIKEMLQAERKTTIRSFHGGGDERIVVDGLKIGQEYEQKNDIGCIYLFNNGIVEMYTSYFFEKIENKKFIIGNFIYNELEKTLKEIFKYYDVLKISLPIIICVRVIYCKSYYLKTKINSFNMMPNAIDRDLLQLPQIRIDEINVNTVNIVLKKVLDSIWNAAGYQEYF